jgi:hypothetical protein
MQGHLLYPLNNNKIIRKGAGLIIFVVFGSSTVRSPMSWFSLGVLKGCGRGAKGASEIL